MADISEQNRSELDVHDQSYNEEPDQAQSTEAVTDTHTPSQDTVDIVQSPVAQAPLPTTPRSSADTDTSSVNTAQSPNTTAPTPVSSAQSPLNTSTKRVKMDGDGDGAPSCASSMEASPKRAKSEALKVGDGGSDLHPISSPSPRKEGRMTQSMSAASTPRTGRASGGGGDLSGLNMTTSWAGSDGGGSAKAGMLADPAKIAKEREKEERVRQARERLAVERRKKLEELREQQRLAQENREKQLELRRRKIEDLRRRDVERRQAVEDRRKCKEDMEKVRRESIMAKSEERVARYEAWKAGGRKGMFGADGASGGTPRHLSMSTSVLYHKGNKEFSSMAALSPASCRPDSATDRKTRPLRRESKDKDDLNKSRDGDGDKDTQDKGAREKSKGRVSLSFFDRLSTPKLKKLGQENPEEKEKSPRNVPTVRVQFVDDKTRDGVAEPQVNKLSPRKAYSTTNLSMMRKRSSLGSKPSLTKDTPSVKAAPSKEKAAPKDKEPMAKPAPAKPKAKEVKPKEVKEPKEPKEVKEAKESSKVRSSSPGAKSGGSTPRVTPPPSAQATPTHTGAHAAGEDGTPTPRSAGPQDVTAEEYKARLAEKRKQVREAREKEAEEERKRQEEERLAEEERERQEEEEQRRFEEEASLLAAEARLAEEERLNKAIEAEEKRKAEEVVRLEAEKLAKEEADKKAKEEAERVEREKQEKSKKEEEERLQRKKKLEMIMKRVKPTDSTPASPAQPEVKSGTSSPVVTPGNTARNSPDEHAKPITSEAAAPSTLEVSPTTEVTSRSGSSSPSEVPTSLPSDMSASFTEGIVPRSASFGDILEDTKGDNNNMSTSMVSTPVRSTENLLSDSPASASRFKSPLLQSLVKDKSNGDANSSPKFKSPLLNSLLGKNKVGARMALSNSMEHLASQKDGRASPGSNGGSNGGSDKEFSKEGREEDKDEDTSSGVINGGGVSMIDSALGSSVNPDSPEGHEVNGSKVNGHDGHKNGMDDSSIVLTPPGSTPLESANGQFEEYIDLLDTRGDNKGLLPGATPIIAFDENRSMDATESLS